MTGPDTRTRASWFHLWRRALSGILFIFFLLATTSPGMGLEPFGSSTLQIESASGRHSFTVEIADNDATRARGLMFRRALAPNHGMLFVYPRARMISMWMKNTFIPLDMIFIDANGVIVSVHERAVPHSLTPISSQKRAVAVLELDGGSVARFSIHPGDRVLNSHFGAAE